MSLSKQTQIRLPRIKHGLITGLTYQQIGEECGVRRETINRDMTRWVQTPDFTNWLREEWIRLHTITITKEPIEAYRQVTKLLAKSMISRAEIKSEHREEITERITIDATRDEDEVLSEAARILTRKRRSQSIH